ncbi:Uncharacterised protein [Mycobacteroides abscessus subsp. abscessus]|nr:Uncharacterised protein [Mycobacteroides abscessus subsp. abscessus]
MPSNGPYASPRARRSSDARASSNIVGLRTGIALSVNPCRSYRPMRFRYPQTSSTLVTAPDSSAALSSAIEASTSGGVCAEDVMT